jgi:hypothetical protein
LFAAYPLRCTPQLAIMLTKLVHWLVAGTNWNSGSVQVVADACRATPQLALHEHVALTDPHSHMVGAHPRVSV